MTTREDLKMDVFACAGIRLAITPDPDRRGRVVLELSLLSEGRNEVSTEELEALGRFILNLARRHGR